MNLFLYGWYKKKIWIIVAVAKIMQRNANTDLFLFELFMQEMLIKLTFYDRG